MQDTILVTHRIVATSATNPTGIVTVLVVMMVVALGAILVWRGSRPTDVQPPNDR